MGRDVRVYAIRGYYHSRPSAPGESVRRHAPNAKSGSLAGFSLVEIMVGMTLLAIIVSSVASLTFHVSRRMVEVSRGTGLNAAVSRDVNRFSALPFDSLSHHVGCDSVAAATETFQQCVTATSVNSTTTRVTIVTTPLIRAYAQMAPVPDTVVIDRTTAAASNPLNTP